MGSGLDTPAVSDEIEKSNLLIRKDVELLTSQINLLKNSVLTLSKFDLLFEEKQKQLDEALKQNYTKESDLEILNSWREDPSKW